MEHTAKISWELNGPDFLKGKYSREHVWKFDGGITVSASPAPHVVPAPWSNPASVDPEEAYVASIASCHMLTFLWLASKKNFTVQRYDDHATGILAKNERGVPWVSEITLRPKIIFGAGVPPTHDEIADLHHRAHEQCFIANSVKTAIVVKQDLT